MPIPVPNPTPAQIVTVASIAMVTTDFAAAMVAADGDQDISNAKWADTLLDIAAWPKYRLGKRRVKKVDNIEFFDSGPGARLDFRNELRRRYGLDDLSSDDGSGFEICYSKPEIAADCC